MSLRFRLPALFLAGIVLSGLVSAALAFRLFADYTNTQAQNELRREAMGFTNFYEQNANVDFKRADLERAQGLAGVLEGFGNGDGSRRLFGRFHRQLFHPFQNFAGESVFIHPFHEQRQIGRITRSHRFYFLEESCEFLFIELSIEVQTEQIISKGNLWRHLEILGKCFRWAKIVAFDCVI